MLRKKCLMITLVAILTAAASGAFGFQDVLETPALKSLIAEKTLLNGITNTGKRLVAVGWRGHILYSDDQGKSWLQAIVPVSSDLVDVCFPSPQKGWAVGHDGIVLHSTDGGATWVKQLDGLAAAKIMLNFYTAHPAKDSAANQRLLDNVKQFVQEGADKPFLSVWFDDENNGFIVGTFNLIFRTSDGGKKWEPLFDRTENPKLLHLNAVRRIGPDLFISGEQGLVMKYDQKTEMFRALKPLYKGSFFGIAGKPGSVVVFGLRGNAFTTHDGGVTWKKADTKVQISLTGGTSTEDGRIVLTSQGGHVLVSHNDGLSFNPIKIDRPTPASAVTAIDKNTILLAGIHGLKLQPLK